ncbi:NAD-dependent epimerase/dehydratase family protein [Candidatus Dojkabacteria bacterium]|nr:NAD-dependent epimerase/dehydratase family protein [Candidatus Dojkabacteria bacterium]
MSDQTKKKYLITGAYGFVGKYLRDFIEAEGEVVIGTGLESENPQVVTDVTDRDQVFAVLSEHKPDYIIHLAGFSSVAKSFAYPDLCHKINVEGTKNLMEGIEKKCPEARVLIISSSHVYGKPNYLPIDEKHPLKGESPYAKSRIEQEKVVKSFDDVNWVISRSFNHTGPGQPLGFVVPDFAHQVAEIMKGNAEPVVKVGNLAAKRDISDVRDVIRAYVLLVSKGDIHEVYNVCSGRSYSIRGSLDELIGLSGVDVEVIVDDDKFRPVDVKTICGSNKKVIDNLGWKRQLAFQKTLEDSLKYFVERR